MPKCKLWAAQSVRRRIHRSKDRSPPPPASMVIDANCDINKQGPRRFHCTLLIGESDWGDEAAGARCGHLVTGVRLPHTMTALPR